MNLDKCILNTRMLGQRVPGETFKEFKGNRSFISHDWHGKLRTVNVRVLNRIREEKNWMKSFFVVWCKNKIFYTIINDSYFLSRTSINQSFAAVAAVNQFSQTPTFEIRTIYRLNTSVEFSGSHWRQWRTEISLYYLCWK